MSISYEQLISTLSKGDIINFKEYHLDRRERKVPTLTIEGAVIMEVFPANVPLNREKLVEVYGEELEDSDYLVLSTLNSPRYLLSLGLSEDNETLNVKVITLNKDFYTAQLQEVEILGSPEETENVNYMLAQRGW